MRVNATIRLRVSGGICCRPPGRSRLARLATPSSRYRPRHRFNGGRLTAPSPRSSPSLGPHLPENHLHPSRGFWIVRPVLHKR